MEEEHSTDQFWTDKGRNFLRRPFSPIYVLLGVSFLLVAISFMVALSKGCALFAPFPAFLYTYSWENNSGILLLVGSSVRLSPVHLKPGRAIQELAAACPGEHQQLSPQTLRCRLLHTSPRLRPYECCAGGNCPLGSPKLHLLATLSSEISKMQAEFAPDPSGHDFYLFPCGPDVRQWEYFNQKCYYFSLQEVPWHQAKAQCEEQKAQLVVINDLAEQNFLVSRIKNEAFWIGLDDIRREGDWQWVDGSNYTTGFKYWKQSEPNNYQNRNEDCVQVRTKGEWNDYICTSNSFYICEKPWPRTATAASKKT